MEALWDVVVVGGGLSGVTVAHTLRHQRGLRVLLIEARSDVGGRLRNAPGTDIDVGGAWLWPSSGQERILEKVRDLGLDVYDQPEDPSGGVRIAGGAVAIVKAMTQQMDEGTVKLDFPVTFISKVEDLIVVRGASGEEISGRVVVVAIPPRLMSNIFFTPPLSSSKMSAARTSNTWMSGVTKVVYVYRTAWWKDRVPTFLTLGGNPGFQMYDGSDLSTHTHTHTDRQTHTHTHTYALTVFATVTPRMNDDDVVEACKAQMLDTWRREGGSELEPEIKQLLHTHTHTYLQRWPNEPWIHHDPYHVDVLHPEPRRPLALPEWSGTLLFAGTETATTSPGYMAGAIEAGLRAVDQVMDVF